MTIVLAIGQVFASDIEKKYAVTYQLLVDGMEDSEKIK